MPQSTSDKVELRAFICCFTVEMFILVFTLEWLCVAKILGLSFKCKKRIFRNDVPRPFRKNYNTNKKYTKIFLFNITPLYRRTSLQRFAYRFRTKIKILFLLSPPKKNATTVFIISRKESTTHQRYRTAEEIRQSRLIATFC